MRIKQINKKIENSNCTCYFANCFSITLNESGKLYKIDTSKSYIRSIQTKKKDISFIEQSGVKNRLDTINTIYKKNCYNCIADNSTYFM